MGRSRGGFSTKIHFLCDGFGHPLTAVLSPGQAHESKSLKAVWDQTNMCGNSDGEPIVPARLAGDKGYRYDWIDHWLLEKDIQPVIASKRNEDRTQRPVEFDKTVYRRRAIVEQMIGWLKECRRVATRYEKLARNYLSMVKLSMIGRYLRLAAPGQSTI
ncbi:IS5 family transposase [Rhodopirellula bahusiensis]|uniref:IS5 family transposase n=1 Tax=Rhodopirellula bahusiensis TaxID=2014065 RepID=UPI003266B967